MKKRLLVTGGSGLLGSSIAKTAAEELDVYATYLSHASQIPGVTFVLLNIEDKQQVNAVFEEIRPDLVIHAAALKIDYCEAYPDEARATNVVGTENVATASGNVGAKLAFISTNAVFDGVTGMYTEEDVPNPTNVYARTKLEAETRALQLSPGCVVVRTAFYGWSLHNGTSLAEQFVGSLRKGKEIPGWTDAFFSPILTNNLAEVLLEMCQEDLAGVFHVGSREKCSKYDFGREIARALDLDEALIRPTSIDQSDLGASRAKDLSLSIAKTSGMILTPLLGVAEGIARFRDMEHLSLGGGQ